MAKISPLNGYAVLSPIEESEQMIGVIIVPDLGKERPETAKVVGTSKVYNYNTDSWVDSSLTVGDTVLIPKMGTAKITFEGSDYYLCKETEILGVINN